MTWETNTESNSVCLKKISDVFFLILSPLVLSDLVDVVDKIKGEIISEIVSENLDINIALYLLMKLNSYFKIFPQRKLQVQVTLIVNSIKHLMEKKSSLT